MRITLLCYAVLVFTPLYSQSQSLLTSHVRAIGALRTVMKDGDLRNTIHLDTISNKKNLYAVGPLNGLTGEITVIDGVSFISQIDEDGKIVIKKTFDVSTPFLVYAIMPTRVAYELPDSISDLQTLENYLAEVYRKRNETPFPFEIRCNAIAATIHIVSSNVADGAGHAQKKVKFEVENNAVVVIGFYSEKHKGIFTHHDSNMHLHLITEDETVMGHVDDLRFSNAFLTLSK